MSRKPTWVWGLVGLASLVLIPVAAHQIRRHGESGCALDGAAINPAYRVRVQDAAGESHEFCCIRCAQLWLKRQSSAPNTVTVADETSGQMIDAAAAYYVRSRVVTMPATQNTIHAFRDRGDAEKHAAAFAGVVLSDSERPLP